jgi:hypothetical protein
MMRPEERAFCEFVRRCKPARALSTPQRYVLAVAMIAGAEVIEWMCGVFLGPPTTFVGLLIAVLVSARFLGAGPAWLTGALAAMNLAYDVPIDERYVGTLSAYLAILLLVRQGPFGGSESRYRRKSPRVGKYVLLARNWFASRLRLRQHRIEQRSAAQQRMCAISSFDAAG